MKLVSFILSLHIILLMSFPISITNISMGTQSAAKSCCSSGKQTKHQEKQNKGCCRNCNPFMVCCNCFALTSQQQHINSPFVYLAQHFFNPSEANDANFLSEVWNPPKA